MKYVSIFDLYCVLFIVYTRTLCTLYYTPTPYPCLPPIIRPLILQMPKMSGLEAILEIRRLEAQAGCEGVYIIAFTADLSETSERSLMNAGANEVCIRMFCILYTHIALLYIYLCPLLSSAVMRFIFNAINSTQSTPFLSYPLLYTC